MFTNCRLPRIACLFVAATVSVSAADDVVPTTPNILLILADDVGREVLGCYGGRSYATPQLDRLATGGIRYTHAYAMPSCHPTRISLLTGQYPFRLGHPDWGTFPQAAEDRALANVLKQAGYATAIAGKWQLTLLKDDPGYPRRLGFDESCLFGWHEGPRYYQPHIWENGKLRQDVADDYGPDIYCQYLIDFMTRNKARPFFALYSMALCHDVTDDLEQPVPFGPRGRYDSYPEMVTEMDEHVGRIVAALDELQLREKTLVLFYSDNGTPAQTIATVRDGQFVSQPVVSQLGAMQIPGGKAQLTDWGTRVPVIASWPGKVRPGQVCEGLVDITDVYPTIVELAGAKPPQGSLDGRSFASQLLGREESTARQWVFAEHKGRSFVKDRRYKLYHDGEIFDLVADPNEEHPLSIGVCRRTRQQRSTDSPGLGQIELRCRLSTGKRLRLRLPQNARM